MSSPMSSAFPARHLLAAALALAAVPAMAADTFSRTVFFGDSLTDSGFYTTFLVENVDPSAAIAARFTTNPGLVWSEWLADYYGTDATPAWQLGSTGVVSDDGDNYAAGGATIAPGPGFPPAPPTQFAPSLTDQIGAYLAANGGRADGDALYTVWGGANDLFFHLNGVTDQATFLSAATAQVGLVATLDAAGARYILVPTMPDVGKTPFGLSQGPAGSAGITQLVAGYNATLFGGLQAAGLRVIPLDTFSFINEITASPSTYGFANATSPACPGVPAALGFCNPAAFVDPAAADTHTFADGVHPSTAAHRLLSQFAISVIEGPRQIAVLPHSAAMTGRARADRVGAVLSTKPENDGRRWWADVRGDIQRYDHGDDYDGAGPALSAGMDWTRGNASFGGFIGYGRQDNDWGQRRGGWDQTEATIGAMAGWFSGNGLWLNGQLGYSRIDFDIDRQIVLGPALRTHRGSTDGSNLTAALNAGWTFGDGALQHGPVLAVVAQRIDIDGFAESEPGLSTSLAYGDQSFDSLIGSVGWQAAYAIHENLQPYVRATWDREFEDPAEEAFAQSQSMPTTQEYAVPGLDYDDSYGTVTFGARTRLFGLDANLGSSLTVGQKGGKHATVFATISGGF